MRPSPDVLGHQPRILIVDDQRSNRELLEIMLAAERFAISNASSGEEALAMVRLHPPDLILLDVMMPGMDGYQVASLIKKNPATRNIPVIMVTESDDRGARMLGLTAGAEDFLNQPVDRAELCVRVRNLLRLKAYGDYHNRYSRLLEGEVGSRAADLVESERLYRSTFDAAPVGIVHVGLDGRWQRVNQRVCDLLGYSRAELEGPGIVDLMQPDDIGEETEAMRQMAAGTLDRHVVGEKRYRRSDGSFLWARVNISIHRGADGQPQYFISVIEDITERRLMEAQIRQAGKMDAIGKLAAGVAHDFNNLLTVILGFAEILASDKAMAPRHASDLAEIVKAAQRATGLTKQLLAFSRQQVLHAVPLDVNRLIEDMAAMLGRLIGADIDVSLLLAPDLAAAVADRSQLEQVVMNLVVNARDAMPAGGTLTIETTNVDLENSTFHKEAVMRGPYVMLAITDTGAGMTRDTQRQLFEPFFTTKEAGKGTGLGLSTTYGIVKQSKGYIWVYSELGRGTTFKVYLPHAERLADAPVVIPAMTVAAPGKTVPETILLVDDEEAVLQFSKRTLENAGYRVLDAMNGDDAQTLFMRHDGAIALLLTDVMMPGCGGPELLKRLHVESPHLKVLFMSGYTAQSNAKRTGLDRSLPYLQKPFTAAGLVKHVRDAIDRRVDGSAA